MEDLSIDQKRLPGVKEDINPHISATHSAEGFVIFIPATYFLPCQMTVFKIFHFRPNIKDLCRDFAVLEDHCLAHNLQEQEIENHLASNVHKSRLVQQDLRVAKRLQEEEDLQAKAQSRRQFQDIERVDSEIAQEIQEQLVRQAEQQRKQEEKDEAIARKLQEKEMKEERKRQKQLEANYEEQYYEDRGAYRHSSDPRVQHPGSDSPASSRERHRDRGRSPDHRSPKLDQKRRPDKTAEYYPAEPGRSRAPEIYNPEGTRGRHDGRSRRPPIVAEGRTKYPEEYLSEKNRNVKAEYTEHQRGKKYQTQDEWDEPLLDQDPMVSLKERPYKDDLVDRDKAWDKERDRARRRDRDQERERERRRNRDKVHHQSRGRSQDRSLNLDTIRDEQWDMDRNGYRGKSRDRDLDRERDRHGARERDREKHRNRDRSRGREVDDPNLPSTSSAWLEESLEDADYGSRQRVNSGSSDVFEEPSSRGHSGEPRSPGHPSRERAPPAGRNTRGEYSVKEATQGLAQIDLRELELRDMEVARKLQEEEMKASQIDKRAAQVAQDEEIARRLMEEEKREYKRSRDKEKQAMERHQRERRPDGDFRPMQEEVVRPRTREEYDYQRARNDPKPVRPPPPRIHNYENVDSSYGYSENYSPRPPSRPDAAYKG
ncbi:hypothetical protein NFI96_014511, partial [Prochilodus magdalenae]